MWNYHALSLPPSVSKRRPKIFHIFLTFDVSQSRSPDLCPALPILTPPHLPGAFLHLKVEPSLPFQLGLKMLKVKVKVKVKVEPSLLFQLGLKMLKVGSPTRLTSSQETSLPGGVGSP